MPIEATPADLAAAPALPPAGAPGPAIDTAGSASIWPLKVKLARVAWSLFSPLFWRVWGRFASAPRIWALRLLEPAEKPCPRLC